MAELTPVPGAVTAPRGFLAGTLCCGIKAHKPDLALIVSEHPATVAVTLTQNEFRGAPTYVTAEHAADGQARAVIINSGSANTATGEQGLANARRMTEIAGEVLSLPAGEVLVASTGHIGSQLPMDKIEPGIRALADQLSPSGGEEAARGIMTTDTFPKALAVEYPVGDTTARIGGICKGAGMICPNMATMLCFLTTDLAIPADLMQRALREAVDHSFNCISVDGDQSTNDTVALFANGLSGVQVEDAEDEDYEAFARALGYVAQELAKMIIRDGERATKFVTIRVKGAIDFFHARRLGRAIANSTLLKAAIYGGDFNWGRLASAVGAAAQGADPALVTLTLAGITPWQRGRNLPYNREEALRRMAEKEIMIEVDLGLGAAEATVWTCDLTPGYVEYNAEYEVSLFAET